MEIWRCGDMEVWRYGGYGGVEMWRCGDMEVWRYGGVETMMSGHCTGPPLRRASGWDQTRLLFGTSVKFRACQCRSLEAHQASMSSSWRRSSVHGAPDAPPVTRANPTREQPSDGERRHKASVQHTGRKRGGDKRGERNVMIKRKEDGKVLRRLKYMLAVCLRMRMRSCRSMQKPHGRGSERRPESHKPEDAPRPDSYFQKEARLWRQSVRTDD
ncbi:hypothetical protein KOW79_019656 [Hemibagrus wyckioides]|uniref:Uncharacterized protein n=1 Tax=Hemibagrus wyckioides TaxID=337641 RepID=A0A9D3SF37_9TELE|nr:hypothetical protein KOW79_019656 [Hemibagrus wyckioides]